MRVANKKVIEAVKKLEKFENDFYDLRTDNVRPDKFDGKYILYRVTKNSERCTGTYGLPVMDFKTQKDFIEFVEDYAK